MNKPQPNNTPEYQKPYKVHRSKAVTLEQRRFIEEAIKNKTHYEYELAEMFGVSRDLIHGLVKKRKRVEIDTERNKDACQFVLDNMRILSDEQIAERLCALLGRYVAQCWVTRVRSYFYKNRRKANPSNVVVPTLETEDYSKEMAELMAEIEREELGEEENSEEEEFEEEEE